MNRTLIKLGPISIYWYSVMIALGFLAAMVVCLTEVKRKKLDIEKYSNMVFYAVLFGILGARIYYVLFNLDYYLKMPSEILKVWHGGLAIHGGIIAGILVVYFYTKKYKMNLAAQWLSENKMKIGDIALELGYSNASKFAKAFQSVYGILPKDYRKK